MFKIPKNIYEQLKPQLEDVFRELIEYINTNGLKFRAESGEIEVTAGDVEEAIEALSKLHSSFTLVESVRSDVEGDYSEYYSNLTERFSILYPQILDEMSKMILEKMYHKAFELALKGLQEVSRAEILYAKTGRLVDLTVFTLLYGNIPQVYAETYVLVEKGSRYAEDIADQIYTAVSREALKASIAIKSRGKVVI